MTWRRGIGLEEKGTSPQAEIIYSPGIMVQKFVEPMDKAGPCAHKSGALRLHDILLIRQTVPVPSGYY